MGTFVTDPDSTLPGPKVDSKPLAPGADANKYLRGSDFNALRDAATDLRDSVRTGKDTQVTATGSTTARTLADRFSDVVNVRDFGAKGDGTDDTVALQAAADAAAGRELVLPYTGSDYVISAPLVLSHGITMRGLGRQVRIRQTASAAVIRVVPADSSANDRIVSLSDLYLVNGTIGLDIAPATYLHRLSSFRKLDFFGQTDTAIYVHGGEAAALGTTWESISIDGPSTPYGLRSVGFAQINASTWTGLLVKDTTTEAVHIEETQAGYQSTAITLISPDVEANAGKGLVVIGAQVVIHGGHMEGNGSTTGGADLDISGGPGGAAVDWFGGYFVAASAAQSNRRVFLSSAGGGIHLRLYGTRFTGNDIIDGNNQTANSRIAYFGLIAEPVLQNFSNGRVHYSENGPVAASIAGPFAQDFSAWTQTRASVGAGVAALDGTSTAHKLIEDTTASNTHAISRSYQSVSGLTMTVYAWVKAVERVWVWIGGYDTADRGAYFDLTVGGIGTASNTTGTFVQSYGNGWYLCAVSYTAASTGSAGAYIYTATANGTRSYTGDGASGVLVWRAGVMAGTF